MTTQTTVPHGAVAATKLAQRIAIEILDRNPARRSDEDLMSLRDAIETIAGEIAHHGL